MQEIAINYLERHEDYFESIDIPLDKIQFYPKKIFTLRNGEEYVALYKRELENPKFFTEFVGEGNAPIGEQPNLYQWEAKNIGQYTLGNYEKYNVPISHFKALKPIRKREQNIVPLDSELEDANMNEMTLRDKCAIEWKRPVSRKEWLNKLILNQFSQQ